MSKEHTDGWLLCLSSSWFSCKQPGYSILSGAPLRRYHAADHMDGPGWHGRPAGLQPASIHGDGQQAAAPTCRRQRLAGEHRALLDSDGRAPRGRQLPDMALASIGVSFRHCSSTASMHAKAALNPKHACTCLKAAAAGPRRRDLSARAAVAAASEDRVQPRALPEPSAFLRECAASSRATTSTSWTMRATATTCRSGARASDAAPRSSGRSW